MIIALYFCFILFILVFILCFSSQGNGRRCHTSEVLKNTTAQRCGISRVFFDTKCQFGIFFWVYLTRPPRVTLKMAVDQWSCIHFFRVPCFSLNLIVYLNVFMNFGELKGRSQVCLKQMRKPGPKCAKFKCLKQCFTKATPA